MTVALRRRILVCVSWVTDDDDGGKNGTRRTEPRRKLDRKAAREMIANDTLRDAAHIEGSHR